MLCLYILRNVHFSYCLWIMCFEVCLECSVLMGCGNLHIKKKNSVTSCSMNFALAPKDCIPIGLDGPRDKIF